MDDDTGGWVHAAGSLCPFFIYLIFLKAGWGVRRVDGSIDMDRRTDGS